MSPGSHVGWLIGTKVTPLGQTMQRNIPAKFGPICFSDSLKEDWNFDQSEALMAPGSHVGWPIGTKSNNNW